jgi:hypothetical protein
LIVSYSSMMNRMSGTPQCTHVYVCMCVCVGGGFISLQTSPAPYNDEW